MYSFRLVTYPLRSGIYSFRCGYYSFRSGYYYFRTGSYSFRVWFSFFRYKFCIVIIGTFLYSLNHYAQELPLVAVNYSYYQLRLQNTRHGVPHIGQIKKEILLFNQFHVNYDHPSIIRLLSTFVCFRKTADHRTNEVWKIRIQLGDSNI